MSARTRGGRRKRRLACVRAIEKRCARLRVAIVDLVAFVAVATTSTTIAVAIAVAIAAAVVVLLDARMTMCRCVRRERDTNRGS